jgi:hypothetical protein
MKRVLVGITILSAALVAGCPIYSDGGNYRVCSSGSCYDCPDTTYSDACIPWQCSSADDCGGYPYACDLATNQCYLGGYSSTQDAAAPVAFDSGTSFYCSNSSQCGVGGVCGRDQACHYGDCGTFGCSAGYSCWIRGGVATCAAIDASATGPFYDAATTSFDASLFGDGTVVDAQTTDAAGDAGDASPMVVSCNDDSTCTGGRCIDGQCVATSRLCSDSTQCAGNAHGEDEKCVNGVCTTTCSAANPCAIGYGCDLTRGLCIQNPTACVFQTDCTGGTLCVEGHCTAPCEIADGGDAATSCPANEVCVNGGCIPDQRATFTCVNNGYTGPAANQCDANQVCLHGDCYASCSVDGGGCAAGETCTEVTILQGTFAVCGNGTNLGSQCDPETGVLCPPGGVCVDGYCK